MCLGDKDTFPVIREIEILFKDREKQDIPIKNHHRYCSKLVSELNSQLNKFNHLEKKDKKYIYTLMKFDYKNRIKTSNLDNHLMDLMFNLINGIINHKIDIFC